MRTKATILTLVLILSSACSKGDGAAPASQFDPSTQTFNFTPIQAAPNTNLTCLAQHPYLEDVSWSGLCGHIDSSYCQSFAATNAQNKALYQACANGAPTPPDLDLGDPKLCVKKSTCASACQTAFATQPLLGCSLSTGCVTNAYWNQISSLQLQACLFSEI